MHLAARPRRKLIFTLLLVFALAGVVGHVEASEGMRGDKCLIAEDEVIVEDFYFFCRVLDVKGTVEGDLIGAAMQITIHDTEQYQMYLDGFDTIFDHYHGEVLAVDDRPEVLEGQCRHKRVVLIRFPGKNDIIL